MAAIAFPVPMAASSLSSSPSTTFLAVSPAVGNGNGGTSRSSGRNGSSSRKSCSWKWEAVNGGSRAAGWSADSIDHRSKGVGGVFQGRLLLEAAPWSGRIESRERRNAWCPGPEKSCRARSGGGGDGQGKKKIANKRPNGVAAKGGRFGSPGNANCRGNAQFPSTNASASGAAEVAAGGDDIGSGGAGIGDRGGGGGGDDAFGGDEGSDSEQNRKGSMAVLAAVGKTLESLPDYLASAVKEGKIPPKVLERFLDLEKTKVRQWLLQFSGFRERLLADDLFLTKVGIECGVGLFTKTGAEYERRRENFMKELDFVIADVLMALVADFMLVWLPAPTVALRPTSLAVGGGAIGRFFAGCPDNAFQVALRGTTYSVPQRVGAIVRNGAKLVVVGTTASLLGTAATNGLIKLRQKFDGGKEEGAAETEDVPILETSLAYGVYMGVSSNLRYQLLAGVVEQRILEPLLEKRKLALSVSSFLVRTGNTFLGSLLWVDYARWVGVQKSE